MRIEFKVLGRPQPAGSKRAFKHPHSGAIVVTDMNKKARPWKQQIAGTAALAIAGHEPFTGPLMLDVTFILQRPKSHYRTGKNSHLLKDSAPEYPIVMPDATKLLRGVEDALTGVVWRDDAQVVTQLARKRYGSPERVEVRVDELDPACPLDGQVPGQIALSA